MPLFYANEAVTEKFLLHLLTVFVLIIPSTILKFSSFFFSSNGFYGDLTFVIVYIIPRDLPKSTAKLGD